jgi:Zn-dependent peptidase ImmA (M78 family)
MLPTKSQRSEIMAEIPVNGKVLEWARKLRGLSEDDAAELLGVPPADLRSYESGAKKPLVGFLRTMSQKYRINFTSLLMPQPLPMKKPPTDHRARCGERPLSFETLVAIEEVNEALEAFEDIASEASRIVQKLSVGTAKLADDPEAVAAHERKKFRVSVEEQREWHGLAEARRHWRQHIEDRGIFTYMIPMPRKELSGFSILHNGCGAICVNDNEPTEGAKVFTLFHEYCHLLLRQTGISDENNTNTVERFCNEFAASFLIPRTPLREAIGEVDIPHEFSDDNVRRLASRFRVSNSAMALRLEKTGLAPKGFYVRHTTAWDIPTEPSLPASKQQPSYVTLRMKRIGQLHAKTVLQAVKRGVINTFDASELIGLQPSSFSKLKVTIG